MTFAVGSLVQARGREWVVLPESQNHDDLLVLRPLVGGDDEVTGIYLPIEPVEPAHFDLPDPTHELGNHRSCATAPPPQTPKPSKKPTTSDSAPSWISTTSTPKASTSCPEAEPMKMKMKMEVATRWDAAVEREKKSRTVFAQQSVKVDEVRRELDAVRDALGDG